MTQCFESILGADLHGLAVEQGKKIVAVAALASARRAPGSALAYRLDFEDGSSLKGRRLFSDAHARRVEYWIAALEDSMLPQVRGRRGAALLLDWVVGESPPHAAGFDAKVHGECAGFQARLHRCRDPQVESTPVRFSVEELDTRLRAGIDVLEAERLLGASEIEALREVAEGPQPKAVAPALVHDDLCGENLVIDRRGRVRVVDNEGLRVGYAAHDLARTVYRWDMDAETERQYVTRYDELCTSEVFRNQREFWMAVVLVESARYRAAASREYREIPLARLRRELRDCGRGERID